MRVHICVRRRMPYRTEHAGLRTVTFACCFLTSATWGPPHGFPHHECRIRSLATVIPTPGPDPTSTTHDMLPTFRHKCQAATGLLRAWHRTGAQHIHAAAAVLSAAQPEP